MEMVKEWVGGNPPNNVFFRTCWVWDGENIFLAHWKKDSSSWELAQPSYFKFKSEKITHYHALSRPSMPTFVKEKNA
jgi:hypothetical protein